MISKILLPIGFIAVGVICLYPAIIGIDSLRIYKLIAGVALILFGVGSIVYELVRRK